MRAFRVLVGGRSSVSTCLPPAHAGTSLISGVMATRWLLLLLPAHTEQIPHNCVCYGLERLLEIGSIGFRASLRIFKWIGIDHDKPDVMQIASSLH